MISHMRLTVALFALMLVVTSQLILENTIALAESFTTTETLSNGTIKICYLYLESDEAPDIEKNILIGENQYSLIEKTKAVPAPGYLQPTKRFERIWTQYIPTDDLLSLNKYFPASVHIEDGQFIGIIELSTTTPYTFNDGYTKHIGRVNRQITYLGLNEEEVDSVPLTQEFEVQSDSEPGAKMFSILKLAERDETVESYDEDGLPSTYKVIATYRGEENYLQLDGEEVAAHYVGEITSDVDQLMVYATYKPVVIIPAPMTQITGVTEPFPFWAITVAGATAVILLVGWLVLWMFIIRKNILLMESGTPDGYYSETLKGKVVKRYNLKLNSSCECIVKLPDYIDPFSGTHRYSIVCKARLASQSGDIVIVWRDKIIARGRLQSIFDIRGREIIESVTSVILEPYPECD